MNQQNNNGNNFQIGDVGDGNVFNVSQTISQGAHTQLVVDPNRTQVYQRADLVKDKWKGLIKIIFAFVSAPLGFVADAYGISEKLSFSVLWILGPAAFLLLWWSLQHMRAWSILSGLSKVEGGGGWYIGGNEMVESIDDGRVLIFSPQAPCIYPRCKGNIVLHRTPPRELARIGRTYVGICDVCGGDHSYRIDYILNAYPERLDWTPEDSGKKT